MEAKVRQVMEFTACDAAVAESLLQSNGGNVEQAVNAIFAGPVQGQESASFASNSAATWDAPIGPPPQDVAAGQSNGWEAGPTERLSPPSQRPKNNDATWAETAGKVGVRRSPRDISKSRGSPVDLTADDDDEDMKKAVQASLDSETDRQKRRQYGPPRGPAQIANDEEEQLTRAIEASMLQSGGGTRPHSPFIQDDRLQSLGATTLRRHDQPQAIVPPSPFMHLFASTLQAIYACAPLRTAILSLRFHDLRLGGGDQDDKSMEAYWKGGSPAGIRKLTQEQWAAASSLSIPQDKVEGLMRLSTLLVYMTFSKRPLCVAEDVISHSPVAGNFAYTMNSEKRPPEQIIACYLEAFFESLSETFAEVARHRNLATEVVDRLSGTFTTYTVLANKDPATPAAIEQYDHTIHLLQRNATNTNVHRAIYARHVDEQSLYHQPGKTLLLSISNSRTTSRGLLSGWDTTRDESAPFTIEPRLFLDYFMSSRRKGEPLDLEVQRVRQTEKAIEDLEKYKRTISTQSGEDSRELLKQTIAYFKTSCVDNGNDPIRTASIAESVPQLEKTLQQLESEIELTDQHLCKLRLRTDSLRETKFLAFEQELSKPENQTICYDICAVIRVIEDTSTVHVVHRGDGRDSFQRANWWRVADGEAHESNEEDALDPTKPPAFLMYTAREETTSPPGASKGDASLLTVMPDTATGRSNHDAMDRDDKPAKTLRLDSEYDWWSKTPLAEAIERDNADLGAQLAQALHVESSGQGDGIGPGEKATASLPQKDDMQD